MPPTDPTELDRMLTVPKETEHLEFKEAKSQFSKDKLVDYCVALGNESGGKLILGVTDKPPRRVVGTQAFPERHVPQQPLVGVDNGPGDRVPTHDGEPDVQLASALRWRNRSRRRGQPDAGIPRQQDHAVPICPPSGV